MLFIRGGRVFDGAGGVSRVATVVIDHGHVVAIVDECPEPGACDEVIDATGKWVMPGFVDTHTHYDAELLVAPGLTESVRHGVTTVFVGSCSLGTVFSSPEDCADLFCRVEALPREQVLPALEAHKTWQRPEDYIAGLEGRPLGPNVAAFLGHSDLRAAVMGLRRAVDARVHPTEAELQQMESHVEEALDAGFIGLSTMTNPWDKVGGERFRSRRLPSTYATWSEYRRLHRILRRRDRVLQSAPNITTKINVVLFLAEALGWGVRKALKTTLISAADTKADPWIHRVVPWVTEVANRLFNGALQWQTVPMPFEVYADGMDLVVFEEFSSGEAALHLVDAVERNALLADVDYRRDFRRDYERRFAPRVWHRDFHDATIVGAPDPGLEGRTFGELADQQGIHPVDAFLDLVVEHGTSLRWKTTIANHRPRELLELACRPSVQVSFADSGAHVRNMAFYNFPLCFLRDVQRAIDAGQPVLTMEQAVHKLTGALADWHGVDAGHLQPGARADIVVVDPTALDDRLGEYHEAPMKELGGLSRMVRRNDDAVTHTLVAGKVVWRDGGFVDGYGRAFRTGSFLRVGVKTPAPV